jgi:hypothetical protein
MARLLRLEYACALYHATSGGDGREAMFRADGDWQVLFDVLAGVWGRFKWIIRAYCLMTNHYLCEASHNTWLGMRQQASTWVPQRQQQSASKPRYSA